MMKWMISSAWLLSGCNIEKADTSAPEETNIDQGLAGTLSFLWNQEMLVAPVIDMGSARRFLYDNPGVLTIRNDGEETVSISIDAMPEWLTISDIPEEIASGESQSLTLSVDLRQPVGELQDVISFRFSESHVESIDLMAMVESYIQYTPQSFPAVNAVVDEIVQENNWVGGAVAVIQDQDILLLHGFGYADLEAEIAVDPQLHRFRWASVSKGMGGVVATQLWREEKLDLDESISTYYPSYTIPENYLSEDFELLSIPSAERAISMRQLLSHTGCVQHYSNGLVDPQPPTTLTADPAFNTGMEWALDYWIDAPLLCIPGTEFHYSTFGYNLAGVVLEQIDGTSYGEMIHNRISDPIEATTIVPDHIWNPAPHRVEGYYQSSNGSIQKEEEDDVSWKLAGGGFTSTPEDFARYCAGLMGEELVSEREKEQILWNVPPNADDYGLGFYAWPSIAAHSGFQQSTQTALKIYREENTCIVVMLNSTWGNPWDLLNAVYDQLP